MKKLYVIFITALFLNAYQAYSQQAAAQLNINNIDARISAVGSHFRNLTGDPAFEVPKGGGKHTLSISTLWISGFDSSNVLHLSAEKYRQQGEDYSTGPLSVGTASTDTVTIMQWDRVWVLTSAEILQFQNCFSNPASCPGYLVPADITDWPAHGDTTLGQSFYLAPFFDANADGVYNPNDGDYPLIRGDQAVFFIFNDNGIPNTESGGTPLGLEVHGMAYAFNCPVGDAFNNTIFMHYKLFNRSNKNYYNTNIGLFTDFDIGFPYDDYIGCDVARGSIFGYNGPAIDGTGMPMHYGALPPAQSLTLLAGPYKDPDGTDNPKTDIFGNQLCDESINGFQFGDGIADNERLGLSRFISINNTGGGLLATQDPRYAFEYQLMMNGYWKDSTQLQYGGNGHFNSSPPAYGPACRFAFPGDSDTCNWGTGGIPPNGAAYWTEETANNTPYDRRGLGVSGPFTFAAGSMHELDYAFVYGRTDSSAISSVDVMKANIDEIRNAFINNITPCGTPIVISSVATAIPKSFPKVVLYPNPANHLISLKFDNEATELKSASFELYNLFGKLVVNLPVVSTNQEINLPALPNGLYLYRVVNNNTRVSSGKLVIKQ